MSEDVANRTPWHKHRARSRVVDLRWGINETAAADQSTMRIFRAETARCQTVTPRPDLVVLLVGKVRSMKEEG